MSHIAQSIRVLKILSQAGNLKPTVVPSFLEQVHQSLMNMSNKENDAGTPTASVVPATVAPATITPPEKIRSAPPAETVATIALPPMTQAETSSTTTRTRRAKRVEGEPFVDGRRKKVVPVQEEAPVAVIKPQAVQSSASLAIHNSVTDDSVTCLACGAVMKLLKRHLKVAHQMDEKKYRQTFGLAADHPLVAPSLSRQRRSRNTQLGLIDKMQQAKKTRASL